MLIYRILSLLHTEMGGKKDKLTQIDSNTRGAIVERQFNYHKCIQIYEYYMANMNV
jgi:hypothetical protein